MTTKINLTVRDISLTETGLSPGWINGEIGKYTFSAKAYTAPSEYGIDGGKVSKLAVYDQKERDAGASFVSACIIHYDRGWDVRPKTSEAREILKAVLAFLEALPVSTEEAIE